MEKEIITLNMSNLVDTTMDLVHQVSCRPGSPWESPYPAVNSEVDRRNIFAKYTHHLANLLTLKIPAQVNGMQDLVDKAIKEKKLVFECVCYPEACHMDVVRIRLTERLKALGFEVKTNGHR